MEQEEELLPKVSFSHFISKFPVVELPILLSEESIHDFSNENPPLPTLMIQQYLSMPDDDEFTEYIPCFKLPDTKDFHAIVYWKAGLMDYQYMLATFSAKGIPIDLKVLSGLTVVDNKIIQSVANIDEEWIITVAIGQMEGEEMVYDAGTSRMTSMELLANGMIVMST